MTFHGRAIPSHKRGHDHIYRKLRPIILERDGHRCQMRLPGCTRLATTVDCIRPVALGGDSHDPANLRAACLTCNQKAGARLGAQIRNRRKRRITPLRW